LEKLHKGIPKIGISINNQQRWFGLDPKASFKITSKQIDENFTLKDDDYILETKWQKEPLNAGDLHKFPDKSNGKRKNTLVFCIAIDEFSNESTQVTSNDHCSLIHMDSMNLHPAFTVRINLDELLYRKPRHPSETGNIYLMVNKILRA